MTPKILFIDGERVAMTMARKTLLSANLDGPHNVHALEEKTLHEMYDWLSRAKERLNAEDWIFAFSDTAHFRRRLFPGYQEFSFLDLQDSPLYAALLKNLRRHVPVKLYPGLEACDVLAVLMTSPERKTNPGIGLTSNVRLQSVPGLWCGFELNAEPSVVLTEDADGKFFETVLTGIPAENVEGCPGMTVETAQALLKPISEQFKLKADSKSRNRALWRCVVDAFQRSGANEDAALLCARLVRICRYEDYDLEKKEVVLWNPC